MVQAITFVLRERGFAAGEKRVGFQSCDDSVAGDWYEVTVVGPQPDGSLTGGASRRILCWRGVTPDGLCV